MGLLNQILGGLAGGAMGRSPMGRMAGGGSSRVVMALLPIVLGMLANRQRGGTRGGMFPNLGAGGGLGSLAGLGGLGGLLAQFANRGYGQQADSWVSTGPNQALSPDAISDVFDHQQLSEIASQAGISEDEARMGLSELIPDVVDNLTPDGHLPAQEQLLSSIDDFERQWPQ